jgi:hypothetical protein
MAVENKYVNTELAAGVLADAGYAGAVKTVIQTFAVAVADDDGSVYRLARIGDGDILLRATIMCDAITSGTDYDMGLYKTGVAGAVVDKDCYMDGQTFASATKTIDGLQTVAIENRTKETWSLISGVTSQTKDEGYEYDIALTANTVGSAAGDVTVILEILKKA